MNWIFPIAGHGTRTSSLGKYKPLIEILPNYSTLKLCLLGLRSLVELDDRLVFIASRVQEKDHLVTHSVKKILIDLGMHNELDMVLLDETPAGQALTVKNGISTLGSNLLQERVLIVNSDQVVFFNLDDIKMDKCSVGLYFNNAPSSCFFDLDIEQGLVKEIQEKKKISCYASAGVFYFTSGEKILECVGWGIAEKMHHNNELYLGPCMGYFEDLSYFRTMIKFDLGNTDKIKLFQKFAGHLLKKEAINA
jgi:hypothetical protein